MLLRALVLDFDGVISESAREAFTVALRTHLELDPGSRLREEDPERLYARFLELMPLGNRAEDYGVALAAIEQGVELPDQEAYDAWRASKDPTWLARFHERFYRVREDLARRDPEGWRRLLRPYRPIVELLRRRAGEVPYAIATSKDRRSVWALLRDYGLAPFFRDDLVLDKEAGSEKTAHLRQLRERLGVDFPALTFVDDKVNHLDAVAPLGVRCVLAAWGYNGPREHALARERGYSVCALEQAEAVLFGTAPGRGGSLTA